IDTLLGGGKQRGARPLEFVSEELARQLLIRALSALTGDEQLKLFPPPALVRWARVLGLGSTQAQERTQWLLDNLAHPPPRLGRLCADANLEPDKACECVARYVDRTEAHNTAGLMRRHLHQGFVRAAFLGDEEELANFLTFGFAELDFKVQPSRQDLVLAL